MKEYINYIIMFVFSLTFFGIYVILLRFGKKREMLFFKKQKEKVSIVKDLLQLEAKIKKRCDELKEYPYVSLYLSQVENIIEHCGFDIDKIEVFTLKDYPEDSESNFDKHLFVQEYVAAKRAIINLVNSCSDTLGRIYRLNHPIKYSIIEFKKNLQLRNLKLVVELHNKMLRKRKVYKHIVKNENIRNRISNTTIKSNAYRKEKSVNYNFINQPLSA